MDGLIRPYDQKEVYEGIIPMLKSRAWQVHFRAYLTNMLNQNHESMDNADNFNRILQIQGKNKLIQELLTLHEKIDNMSKIAQTGR